MIELPDDKVGDVVDIPGFGSVRIDQPMGGAPFPEGPAPDPSEMTPTHKSDVYGSSSSAPFEQGNDASDPWRRDLCQ